MEGILSMRGTSKKSCDRIAGHSLIIILFKLEITDVEGALIIMAPTAK